MLGAAGDRNAVPQVEAERHVEASGNVVQCLERRQRLEADDNSRSTRLLHPVCVVDRFDSAIDKDAGAEIADPTNDGALRRAQADCVKIRNVDIGEREHVQV